MSFFYIGYNCCHIDVTRLFYLSGCWGKFGIYCNQLNAQPFQKSAQIHANDVYTGKSIFAMKVVSANKLYRSIYIQ